MFSSGDFQLHCMSGQSVKMVWALIEPYLIEAIKFSDGKYSLPGIEKMLLEKHAILFFVTKENEVHGVLVLKINEYEKSKRACLFLLAGKELHDWICFLETIKKWVKDAGCDALELFGRIGWEKKLNKFGFEKTHVVMRLALKD